MIYFLSLLQTDVCDMSDNLIGLISGEREVTVEKAIESLYNAPINCYN